MDECISCLEEFDESDLELCIECGESVCEECIDEDGCCNKCKDIY